MVQEREIVAGLVLHLDPRVLEAHGAATEAPDLLRVQGTHFFVCLEVAGRMGRWMPCFSRTGIGRLEIPAVARDGHEKWTSGECWFHPGQVWLATHQAVIAAASIDQSVPGFRSYVDLDLVECLLT